MQDKAYTLLLRPIITEKSMEGQENGKYTFLVAQNSNKTEIKQAIESLYGVTVESMNKIKTQPKKKLIARGKYAMKRKAGIKMVITLKKGQTLDFAKLSSKK